MRWRNTRPSLEEHHLAGAELLLGVRFPADYRECLRVNHGATPDPAGFLVSGSEVPFGSGVGCLLTVDPYASENLFVSLSLLACDDQLPPGLIPIAEDGGGDFVCLDYRTDPSRSRPTVAYWCHELEGDDGIVHLAHSFTAFLETLSQHSRGGA